MRPCLDPPTPLRKTALKGSLFPLTESNPSVTETKGVDSSTNEKIIDAELSADATARPRQRITPAINFSDSGNDENETTPDSDEPAWSHHSHVEPQQLTPMLRHYLELKAAHPERVLLYRLGDFFKCFFEDAFTLSRMLELTLTGKEGGKAVGRVPMASIPHHAAERYCSELIRQGFRVALCDQREATLAKGALLKRDITRVLTPGTVLEKGMLEARRNNWLAAVVVEQAQGREPLRWGLVSADVSAGEVQVMQQQDCDALNQLGAAELLCSAAPPSSTPHGVPISCG